jgi:oligopeptide/dipeptide ABC transporter ATP-binding protein
VNDPVLDVRGLYAQYVDGPKRVRAVDGVSFALRPGSVLALVGESGCGKTTVALSLLGLLPYAGRIAAGEALFDGIDLLSAVGDDLRRVRGRKISMVFQDPVAGLNPVLTVGQQVEEAITTHRQVSKRESQQLALEALRRAGLPRPEDLAKRYPYQLSGGMCQRVVIAIATVLGPKVIIADEPTSALDVTVQAGILRELRRLRDESGVAILLITHDLGVVAQMADEVAVMYGGRIAEQGPTRQVLRRPLHPYTWSLLATLPRLDRGKGKLTSIPGAPVDASALPEECAFAPRCRKALNVCRAMPSPPLVEMAPAQRVACYNPVVHLD